MARIDVQFSEVIVKRKLAYHIIINERSPFLYESSNSKCQVFNRPVRNSTAKFSKPEEQTKGKP